MSDLTMTKEELKLLTEQYCQKCKRKKCVMYSNLVATVVLPPEYTDGYFIVNPVLMFIQTDSGWSCPEYDPTIHPDQTNLFEEVK